MADGGRPVRFGVLGCADIAWRRMLPAMLENDQVRVVAVASRAADRAARFADRFGAAPVVGYERLLERDDIDAVYVPLPAMLHAEWIEAALLAGRHVLAEKPMTAGYESTIRLVELARERSLALVENYAYPHHSQHHRLAELLAGGAIGELRDLSCTFTIPPKPPSDIRYQPDVGGGAFLDIGVYPVHAALRYLHSELSVAGAVFRRGRESGAVLSGSALLYTPEGASARLAFGMEHAYRNRLTLLGATGRIELDRVFTPAESYQPVLRVEREDRAEELVLPADHQFANVLRFFVDGVRGEVDLSEARDMTVRQARLIDEITAAARVHLV